MKRVLLAGCVAVAGVLSQSAVASDGKVKIGVLTDLSGPAQDIGKGSVVAAQIAIEEFGGKVLGKEIEFISGDTSNKPDVASAVARQWIDIEKVDVLVDLGLTHTALAVLPIAADKNKIAIAVSPAGTNITNEACTATSIHWMYDTYALAAGTSRVLVDKGMKNWFFITTDYAFGHALEKDARDYITSAGGNVVGTVRHPFNASDMSSFVLTAQGSKANVIALANSNNDTVNAVKQAQEYGVTPTQYVAPLVMYLSTVHGMGLDLAQGLYLTEGFYWNQDERARGFAEKFKAKTKTMPGSLPAGTYSAVLNYLKAVEKAGSDDTETVMKTLRSMEIDDAVVRHGKIRADGRLIHDMYVFQVKSPAESKEPFDYYNTVGVVKGDDAFQPLAKSRCPLVKKSQ
ncbi:MAG: ABC transporter substrate-binding protein [Xanthobacteraceae bacterium]|jgi:branched-chain amino acid transport system substrate-binding protein